MSHATLSAVPSTATSEVKKYLNVSFDKTMWCEYSGHCRVDQLIFNKLDVCLLCKHRIPIDIPTILEGKNNEHIKH